MYVRNVNSRKELSDFMEMEAVVTSALKTKG